MTAKQSAAGGKVKQLRSLFFGLVIVLCGSTALSQCPDSCDIWTPNTLTPDCDYVGCDEFEIATSCSFTKFDLTIYDRWGELIFHSTDPKKRFQCIDTNDQAVKEGCYLWVLKGLFCNDQKIDAEGRVLVLR